MAVRLLTEHNLEFLSLKGGSIGLSESTLVEMPHCWKSHVTAQMSQFMRSNVSSRGSDEPPHLQNIVRALTPHIHMERIKMKIHA